MDLVVAVVITVLTPDSFADLFANSGCHPQVERVRHHLFVRFRLVRLCDLRGEGGDLGFSRFKPEPNHEVLILRHFVSITQHPAPPRLLLRFL